MQPPRKMDIGFYFFCYIKSEFEMSLSMNISKSLKSVSDYGHYSLESLDVLGKKMLAH